MGKNIYSKEIKSDKYAFTFQLKAEKFPGKGGWIYVSVPEEYTEFLKTERKAWGMYPVTAQAGDTERNWMDVSTKGCEVRFLYSKRFMVCYNFAGDEI